VLSIANYFTILIFVNYLRISKAYQTFISIHRFLFISWLFWIKHPLHFILPIQSIFQLYLSLLTIIYFACLQTHLVLSCLFFKSFDYSKFKFTILLKLNQHLMLLIFDHSIIGKNCLFICLINPSCFLFFLEELTITHRMNSFFFKIHLIVLIFVNLSFLNFIFCFLSF
jgi:hypothetical protein